MKKAKAKKQAKRRPSLRKPALREQLRTTANDYYKACERAGNAERELRTLKAMRNEPPPWISDVWVAQNRAIERFDNAVAVITRAAARDGRPEDLVPFFPDNVLEEEWVRRAYFNLFKEYPSPGARARDAVITKLYERQPRTT